MKRMVRLAGSRRSQAAMEYVHTYGWIILSVLVLGGVNLYYNVSNAEYLIPSGCTFLSGIECIDFETDQDLLSLVLANKFGFAIGNITLEVTGTCNSTANTTDGNPYANPGVLVENQQATFVLECQNLTNMRLEQGIRLDYVSVDTGRAHTKFGTLQYSPGE